MQNKLLKSFGYIFVALSLFIPVLFVCFTKLLVPTGYELAVEGVIISRNLMLIFIFYTLSKIGYYFLKK